MDLKVSPSRVKGQVSVPGSKSHTIRGIIAALMANGKSILHAPLSSADTISVLNAAKILGANVVENENSWEIVGTSGIFNNPKKIIDLGNSGTGLRMLTGVCAMQNFLISFDGDSSLRTRGMKGVLDVVEKLGVEIVSNNGKCPLSIDGSNKNLNNKLLKVDGTSSQYLTSLLFALPVRKCDTELSLDFLNEKAYVEITLEWLKFLGIDIQHSSDCLNFLVKGNQKYNSFEKTIPADFSTACFPLAAGAIIGDGVEILNLDFSDAQGDKAIFNLFEKMGATFDKSSGELKVCTSNNRLIGGEFDLNDTPDALPIMAVAGALAVGETKLYNVAQARLKETDRIAVMAKELRKMGVNIVEMEDGLIIQGQEKLQGAVVESYDDHRIAMALAIGGLKAEGETTIKNAQCVSVTYPNFINDFQKLGAKFSI